MGFTVLVLCRAPFYICLDKVRIYFLVCLMELYCVFTIAVGTAGNLGLPSRGPISWEEMGERTPGGGGSSPGTPFSGGVVWGRLYFSLITWPAALTLKGP